MLAYVLRRLAMGVVLLFVASFLVFLLVSYSGDPLALLRSNPHIPRATILAREKLLHLNESVPARYWTWLTGVLHGDFGADLAGNPVGPQLWHRLLITLRMVIAATALSVILAVIVGVVSAIRQYSVVDYVATSASYIFISTPVFVIGLLLKEFVAINFNKAVGHTYLYTVGEQSGVLESSFAGRLGDYVAHTALPVLTLVLITYAAWSRYQRAELLDVASRDYIRLARAKGISPRRVLVRHMLRNALIPVVTVVGLDTAAIFGGAIVTESVFGWQGMGQFFLQGVTNLDVNVVLAWLLVTALIVVMMNILVDVLYASLDPRIRYA
ncbi:MAG TPA: ABC transporter permease [Acidimicrobiales bacterium]|nr:ABC transporter permease [Acidimicrobiales bacterium]